MAAMETLEEFGATRPTRARSFWRDELPEDVREQLVNSDLSTVVCVEWLKRIGYDGTSRPLATVAKIDQPRREAKQQRGRAPDAG